MPAQSNYGDIVYLAGFGESDPDPKKLSRVPVKQDNGVAIYQEKPLQKLITKFPGLLGIAAIEPDYASMQFVCEEFEVRGKFIDNIFITPEGGIALVECKLWRNSASRRNVIAQILEYAALLSQLSFEDFEDKLLKNVARAEGESLFQMVCPSGAGDESAFYDAVSRNLRRGRFLLIIVGDGIQEDLASTAEYLQKHPGLEFTLALLELGIFELPQGGYIAQPRLVARTENIVREVIRLPDGRLQVVQAPAKKVTPATMSEEAFFETLLQRSPEAVPRIHKLLQALDEAGANVKALCSGSTLTLRWLGGGVGWNLGTISPGGSLYMDYHASQALNLNFASEGHRYLDALAHIDASLVVMTLPKSKHWNLLTTAGKAPQVVTLLSDSGIEAWVAAVLQFEREVQEKDQQ